MNSYLEKVTAFITRQHDNGTELLLFEHPNAGIQFPAGTVEESEPHLDAVLRETHEETGLKNFVVKSLIGYQDTILPEDRCVILHRTTVYCRPDLTSFDWAVFRRGLPCQILREANSFLHVNYTEYDRFPEPQYVTYQITGWVPSDTITRHSRRYFYHLISLDESANRWANNMQRVAQERGVDVTVEAMSTSVLDEAQWRSADVVLVGPQMRHLLPMLAAQGAEYKVPVEAIPSQDYATANGQHVLEQAYTLVQNQDFHQEAGQGFQGA